MTSIDENPFFNCPSLSSIIVDAGNSKFDSRDNCNAIIKTATNILIAGCMNTVIPNSVTSIGGGAFDDCTGLTSVTIPNSVTSIGNYAFYGCTGLTSMTIPNSVTSIGESAFSACTGLTSVTIPNSVTEIGGDAFYGCTGLTEVTIPNSVTSIGEWAFSDCTGLTSVTIPNSVTSIGKWVFYRCTGLTSVTIPNSVTEIGGDAFSGCTGLTSVTIPNSVTAIGEWVFYECRGMENIYTDINPSKVTLGSYVFSGVPKETCVLHVEEEYLDLFKTADQWKDFYNIVGDYSAITTVKVDNGIRVPVGYYDMNGVFHSEPVSGVNIIKYNDGAFEKKLMK